jgi:hypothetical protein
LIPRSIQAICHDERPTEGRDAAVGAPAAPCSRKASSTEEGRCPHLPTEPARCPVRCWQRLILGHRRVSLAGGPWKAAFHRLSTAYPQGCQRILWTGTDLFRGCPTDSAVNIRSLAWFPILDLSSSQGASDEHEYADFWRDRAGVGRTLPRRVDQDHSVARRTGDGQPHGPTHRHEGGGHEETDPVGHAREEGRVMAADVISVDLPMTFKKRGGRKVIVLPDGTHGNPAPTATIDNTMIKAVARAFRWQRLLENGTYYGCLDEIAKAERIGPSFVSRVIRLALLALAACRTTRRQSRRVSPCGKKAGFPWFSGVSEGFPLIFPTVGAIRPSASNSRRGKPASTRR